MYWIIEEIKIFEVENPRWVFFSKTWDWSSLVDWFLEFSSLVRCQNPCSCGETLHEQVNTLFSLVLEVLGNPHCIQISIQESWVLLLSKPKPVLILQENLSVESRGDYWNLRLYLGILPVLSQTSEIRNLSILGPTVVYRPCDSLQLHLFKLPVVLYPKTKNPSIFFLVVAIEPLPLSVLC